MKKYLQTIVMTLATVVMFSALPLSNSLANNDSAPILLAQEGKDAAQDGLRDVGTYYPDTIVDEDQGLKGLLKSLIEYALYLGAIIAVFFIIYGGYQYIFSAGDDAKAKSGRKTATNALIGLVIIILAYAIVQIVYNFITKGNP